MDGEEETPNAAPITVASNDVIRRYLDSVCSSVFECESGSLDSVLLSPTAEDQISTFARDSSTSILLVKSTVKDEDRPPEYSLASEVTFDGSEESDVVSVAFIKKAPVLDADQKISFQLQVIHIDENSPFDVLHSYVHNTFKPLLTSFIANAPLTKEQRDDKRGVRTVSKKISELEVALLHCKQEKEVPDVNLQTHVHPEIRTAASKLDGRKAIDDFVETFSTTLASNQELQNQLGLSIFHWSKEIRALNNLDRDPTTGSAAQEVNFWLSMERVLADVDEQAKGAEIDVTLASFQKLRLRRELPTQFDVDVREMSRRLDTVRKYNNLMREFPINDLLAATDLTALASSILKIFKHTKQFLPRSAYPLDRAAQLLEAVSRDLTSQLTDIIRKKRLFDLQYSEFVKVVGFEKRRDARESASGTGAGISDGAIQTALEQMAVTCEHVFCIWTNEDREFCTLSKGLEKKRGGSKRFPNKLIIEHASLQERIVQIVDLRREHENLRTVIKKVMRSATSGEKTHSKMEVDSLETMKKAYASFKVIDVTDVSAEGKQAFEGALDNYHKMVERVENQMTSRLRDQLGAAQNANEMFRVFAVFNPLLIRPKIRGAIQEYQNTLIQRVKEDVKILQDKFRAKYSKSEAAVMSQLRDLPPLSGAIIWARQVERQLNTYMKRIEDVLGEGWQQHVEGQKLKKDGDSFREKLKAHAAFQEWSAEAQTLCGELEVLMSSPIFAVVTRAGLLHLSVNFDARISDLLKEVRNLEWLGFSIPLKIRFVSTEAKLIHPCAISLSESVRSYSHTLDSVDPSILPLLASSQVEVQDVVSAGTRLKWEPDHRYLHEHLEPYARKLAETVLRFEERVAEAQIKHSEIERMLQELVVAPLEGEALSHLVRSIQNALSELELGSYSNLPQWASELDDRVEQVLRIRLRELIAQLVAFYEEKEEDPPEIPTSPDDDGMPTRRPLSAGLVSKLKAAQSTHEIKIKNQVLFVEPPLELARVKWMEQFGACLAIICDLPRVKDSSFGEISVVNRDNAPDTYSDLLTKLPPEELSTVYSQTQGIIRDAEQYLVTWLSYQALWDIDSATITERLGDDLDLWQTVLSQVKSSRAVFDTSETRRSFGPITINYHKVQAGVTNRYDAWHRELLAAFAERLASGMHKFYDAVSSMRTELENISLEKSTGEAIVFLTKMHEIKKHLDAWGSDLENFRTGQRTLEKNRFKFPSEWLYLDMLEGEWSAMSELFGRKEALLKQEIPHLQERIMLEDQDLEKKIKEAASQWTQQKPLEGSLRPSTALDRLAIFDSKLTRLNTELQQVVQAKRALEMDASGGDRLVATLEEVADLKNVWSLLSGPWDTLEELGDIPWSAVQPKKIRAQLEELQNNLKDTPTMLRSYAAYEYLQGVLKGHLKINYLLIDLRSHAMKDRHWETLSKKCKTPLIASEMTLATLWDLDLSKYETVFRDVITVSQGELALEEFLKQVREHWADYSLDLVVYQKKTSLIRGWDDLFTKCGEHTSSLQSMKNSPYFKVFEEECTAWEDKLNRVREIFDVWIEVQRKWVYLESIFLGSAEIKHQLPMEFARFQSIDNEFVGLMKKVTKAPQVLEVIAIPDVLRSLERLGDLLGKIQKSLSEYLEQKRAAFPRFYFVGDEDLLEIIGNSKDPARLQRHVKKMFAGIASIQLDEEAVNVLGMASSEGEVVPFTTPVSISEDPNVSVWLSKVEAQARVTLATITERAVIDFDKLAQSEVDAAAFISWLDALPAQIVVLALQIVWTARVEKGLQQVSQGSPEALETLLKMTQGLLSILTESVLCDLPAVKRRKIEHSITELVHHRDAVRQLIVGKAGSVDDFQWLFFMRFYWSSLPDLPIEKRLDVKVADGCFKYGFEYQGVADRLVQTPLTDRAYLTLTQALHSRMGGSPFGPAGTGKTETVKAMGVLLGRFTLVFNCDEAFDLHAMGRIFLGLCQTGAWGCFDEFNRLEERILSAVSQQILTIQLGIRQQQSEIELINRSVKLNSDIGIFVTMNPGYAGRANLPDNLKQLFRSIAMTRPDSELIAQVMLFSQGFKSAERLSRKVVALFRLCADQLSDQRHYDFGLRALKSVLVSSGNIKRAQANANPGGDASENGSSEKDEEKVIIQSFCGSVVPKLVGDDISLLYSLLSDVFPGAGYDLFETPQLRELVKQIATENHFVPSEAWVDKIMQLDRITQMHHGVMLVGPSGSGKSSAWRTLLEAFNRLDDGGGEAHVMDPKALKKDELYGHLDPTTREWSDGVFTTILRRILDNLHGAKQGRQWIVFDGDVDPEWVENLNSVLDDNKLLTLPNGERLALPPSIRIVFEVQNLAYATPATVSRCGMVWFSENVVTVPMMNSRYLCLIRHMPLEMTVDPAVAIAAKSAKWPSTGMAMEKSVQEQCATILAPHFEQGGLVQRCLEYSASEPHIMDFTEARLLTSFYSLISRSINDIVEYNNAHSDFHMNRTVMESFITKSLVQAILWGFGGSTSLARREKFGNFIKETAVIPIPDSSSGYPLIDYEVSIDNGEWSLWKNKVPQIEIETTKVASSDVLIATVDTVRHEELLRGYLNDRRPFILCGPPGSGKTMTITAALRSMPEAVLVPLNFSSGTQPELILKTFEHYCEYRRTPDGVVLRPIQAGSWLIVFCDECNLPSADRYGTQRVITFMRQLTEQGGFWRTSDRTWVWLDRIQFIGACNPPTDAGRVPLSHRFLRHAPLLYVDFPGLESLTQIYGTFCRGLLRLTPSLRANADPLTAAMVDMYSLCRSKFTAEAQSHYIFSPRELSRWMRGLYESMHEKEGITIEDLLQLWAHEGLRLFQDRVVDQEERDWVDRTIDELAAKHFPHVPVSCIARPLLFSRWLTKDYTRVSPDELRDFVQARLRVFCEEEFNVQLVVFDSVLDHILRIDRVLRQPLGHALLIGASGAGKTVLSRFVAWMNKLNVFQIKAHRAYTVQDFEDDLRKVMKRAGCKGEKICFIFDESNVLDAGFLELMNALLASGEVPGLFDGDEYSGLMQACKEAATRDGLMLDTEEELFRRFTQQVQRNLHVVFTMNPASADFQNRSTTSPALFNRCVIDWVGDWSTDALQSVASEFTARLDIDDVAGLDLSDPDAATVFRQSVVSSIVYVHESVGAVCEAKSGRMGQHFYITPRHYLDFIQHFVKLYHEKRTEVQEQQLHLNQGLQKLRETEEDVSAMKAELAVKEETLKSKNDLANQKLQQMVHEQQEAEKQRELSIKLSADLAVQAEAMQERRADAQKDLDQAEPMVEEAQKAVKGIKKAQLDELRTMANPPAMVKLSLEAVCMMMYNMAKPSWDEIRRTIRRDDFIPGILSFDTDEFKKDSKRLKALSTYTNNPDFTFEVVNRSSKACGPLVKWCSAQCLYASVLEKVDPLRREVSELQGKADALLAERDTLDARIAELEVSIGKYKEEYAVLIADVQQIKIEMKTVADKVERSTNLLASLSQERVRWEGQKEAFGDQMKTMVGDVLLSSAFMAYCGMFEQETRRSLVHQWMNRLDSAKVFCRPELSFTEFLSTGDTRLVWHANGLPEDDLCIENGIMLQRYNRYPLVIDPSGQAIDFLMKQHADKKMVQTSFLHGGFLKQLESCMRFGTPLLVTDVERVDPILNPVLNREVHKAGGRVLIRLGENDIDLSPAFTLFLSTRDSTYHFAPDLCSRVTLVNFTITPSGLQNQCLSHILKAERPDVDQKRTDLLKLQGEYRVRLRQLESQLLSSLSEAKGNILEDSSVLATLERLKKDSDDIATKMSQTEAVMEEVQNVSQFYEPLSLACSRVFFVLEALDSLHFLYQFSINFFFALFESVLNGNERLQGVTDQQARLGILMTDLFSVSFSRVCRSLLHRHRLVVAFRFVQLRLQCNGDDMAPHHIDFLLRGGASGNDPSSEVKQATGPCALTPVQEARLADLVRIKGFNSLPSDMASNAEEWKHWILSPNPETLPVPSGSCEPLNQEGPHGAVSRLMIIRALRPDRVLAGGAQVVNATFGPQFLDVRDPDLEPLVMKEASSRIPIILVSLPGFDASGRVDDLASRLRVQCRSFAMGSPDGFEQAENAVYSSAGKGTWILLKNVHLAAAWLQTMEKRVHSLDARPEFRLFMTMEINEAVPANLLRTGQVVVYEPPVGVKASLQRSLSSIPADRIQKAPAERGRLFLLVAWLHAVVLGRLRYSPLGWSKLYEFSEADQLGALDCVDAWLDAEAKGRSNLPPDRIPWRALRTLLRDACYGGRIDNPFDGEALASFIGRFLNTDCYAADHALCLPRFDGSGVVNLPDVVNAQTIREWVEKLPDTESPLWLGLPENADVLLRVDQGRECLSGILQLQAGLDEGDVVSQERDDKDAKSKWGREALSSAQEFLNILPETLGLDDISGAAKDSDGPVARFFRREVQIAISLLKQVRASLLNARSALSGDGAASNETRNLSHHLTKGTLPTNWADHHKMSASTTLREWIVDLTKRLEQLQHIAPSEVHAKVAERKIWLGGLFQVEGYFTATRQEMARAHDWPLERLELSASLAPHSEGDGSHVGASVVTGASIQGALVKDGLLTVGSDAAQSLPPLAIRWRKLEDDTDKQGSNASCIVPIYFNGGRGQVLVSVPLPLESGLEASQLYERSVGILLSGEVE